jgi:hypothetical protein
MTGGTGDPYEKRGRRLQDTESDRNRGPLRGGATMQFRQAGGRSKRIGAGTIARLPGLKRPEPRQGPLLALANSIAICCRTQWRI